MSKNPRRQAFNNTLATGLILGLMLGGLTVSHEVLAKDSTTSDIYLGGLLVNKTITWFGQDFYHYFAREWRTKNVKAKHTIVVEEKPSARNGSKLVIWYKGEVVFQTAISNTRSASRKVGGLAVPLVLSRLQGIDLQAINAQHSDLASAEF